MVGVLRVCARACVRVCVVVVVVCVCVRERRCTRTGLERFSSQTQNADLSLSLSLSLAPSFPVSVQDHCAVSEGPQLHELSVVTLVYAHRTEHDSS